MPDDTNDVRVTLREEVEREVERLTQAVAENNDEARRADDLSIQVAAEASAHVLRFTLGSLKGALEREALAHQHQEGTGVGEAGCERCEHYRRALSRIGYGVSGDLANEVAERIRTALLNQKDKGEPDKAPCETCGGSQSGVTLYGAEGITPDEAEQVGGLMQEAFARSAKPPCGTCEGTGQLTPPEGVGPLLPCPACTTEKQGEADAEPLDLCVTMGCPHDSVASVEVEDTGWHRYCNDCAETLARGGDPVRWDATTPSTRLTSLQAGLRAEVERLRRLQKHEEEMQALWEREAPLQDDQAWAAQQVAGASKEAADRLENLLRESEGEA